MSKNKGSNKENFEKTSLKFLKIAKKEFIEYGYSNASTERIVEQSGMARGSLYYHYGNKEGIFRAVYEDVVEQLGKRIQKEIDKEDDPFLGLKKGCRLFYQECDKPEVRIIMLIEGITNIPYKERIKILEPNMIILIKNRVAALQEQNRINGFDAQALIVFIYGMLAEVGRLLEYVGDKKMNIDNYSNNLDLLLDKIIEK